MSSRLVIPRSRSSFAAMVQPLFLMASLCLSLCLPFALSPKAIGQAQTQEPEIEVDTNLIDGRSPEGPLRPDLCAPTEGEGPYPVVIVIHGGAWTRGNKVENRPIMNKLAEHGYIAISPQFRLVPENPFPIPLSDLKETIRWVKTNAKARLFDAKHIAVYGQNSGGHLALLLGTTDAADNLDGSPQTETSPVPNTRVQAVVCYYSPTDLTAPNLSASSQRFITALLGAPASEKPELARKASPITYLSKGDPPILAFHNRQNRDIPFSQAESLIKAAEKAGVDAKLFVVPDPGTVVQNYNEQNLEAVLFDFLDPILKRN